MIPPNFRLDPVQVETTFADCLGDDIEVDAIVSTVRFDKQKLADHGELIGAMLLELPTEFRASTSGGWSFMQACLDRRGNQWTGLHQTMARLFALGMGAGLVKSLFPREMWDALPGGMPYYVVLDDPAREQAEFEEGWNRADRIGERT